MSRAQRRPDAGSLFESTERADTEECVWCHWRVPSAQMTMLGGRRLCVGCMSLYLGYDEEEEEG